MPASPPVVDFHLGDVVTLRRPHACGGRTWQVSRLGADIGLVCAGCGRRVLLERRQLERRLVGFVTRGPAPEAATPAPDAAAPATGDVDD
jgi:hypothetical protein